MPCICISHIYTYAEHLPILSICTHPVPEHHSGYAPHIHRLGREINENRITDPDEALRSLYRQLILGQTFAAPVLSRDTLRFLLELAHQGYSHGQGQLVSLSRLRVLLEITFELLAWQVEDGHPVDSPYLKGTFGLAGEDWQAESARFLAQLTPGIEGYAEQLLRPLAGRVFDLNPVPDAVLATVFTRARLKAIFPLCVYARDGDFDTLRRLMDQVRPAIPAVRETLDAGPVKMEIHITGQEPGTRPGGWYETPRLFLVVQGQDFMMPFDHELFSELLRTLAVWHAHPEALEQGWHGRHVMFSPGATAGNEVIVGLDALRLWLPEAGFDTLVRKLTAKCAEGALAEALDGLRCLYGDL